MVDIFISWASLESYQTPSTLLLYLLFYLFWKKVTKVFEIAASTYHLNGFSIEYFGSKLH